MDGRSNQKPIAVEAEFFAASTMSGEDLREEIALRTLRSRKSELGSAFFVPRILRAVVTYNAVLLDRVAAEILESGDCRSLAVLSVELQAVGISPDDVSDHWTLELSSIFQEQTNESISRDAYKIACALSELKNKFLSTPVAHQFRQQKEIPNPSPNPKRPSPAPKRKEPTARNLVMDALDASRTGNRQRKDSHSTSGIQWPRIAQAALAIGLFIFARSFFFGSKPQTNSSTGFVNLACHRS